MAELVKRWRGGTAADKGFSDVGAKINLAKKQKAEPNFDWRIAPHPYLADRFELQAFETQPAIQPGNCESDTEQEPAATPRPRP